MAPIAAEITGNTLISTQNAINLAHWAVDVKVEYADYYEEKEHAQDELDKQEFFDFSSIHNLSRLRRYFLHFYSVDAAAEEINGYQPTVDLSRA